ncbi:helix-turn-helix domain-containing protein [Thalassospira tepidiphila]|jgi:AraC-like DNA-binding protein|uniref:helix-turn-helix domain-containing protein n=1 Tax=Thalassospira tepidiphila TaxID=393657 RepID=UPI001BD0A244|nr:helix-turn-helix domain-containing protein [Thalassospira tepidiphila]MBS8273578.1 helix-turn-helix domain-containing protein [Thalassospira tepidiphila]
MTKTILRSRFDVAKAQPTARYDLWQDSIGCVFDVDVDKTRREDGVFNAVIDAFRFDEFMVAKTTTVQQNWWRTPFNIARDGMDHYMIQFFLKGGMQWQTRRTSGDVGLGDLIVFDMAEEMQSITDDFCHISLIIPRAALAPRLDNPDGQHMRHLKWNTPIAAMLSDYMMLLGRNLPNLGYEQLKPLIPSILSMVAVCLNDDPSGSKSQSYYDQWYLKRRIKSFILQNLGDSRLGAQGICDAMNLSRSNLYRMFEDEGGVKTFIRENRLKRSLRQIVADEKCSVSVIAEQHGFASPSDFSRAFRNSYGLSPREARNQYGLTSQDFGGSIAEANICRDYEGWIQNLALSEFR